MKIAFLHHSFIIGSGIDSLIYQYAKRLGKKHQVEIFTFRSYYKLPIQDWQVNVINIPFGKTRLGSGVFAPMFMPWHKMRKSLKHFDVVISQLYPTNLIPVLPSKIDTKVVTVEWSTPSGVWSSWQERAYTRLLKWASGIACRRSDKVLVSSMFAQRYVRENFNVSSDFILLDGLDFDLLNKDKYIGEEASNILYVGRISPHKNLHTLIKAFSIVKEEIPGTTLTLVGGHTFPSYFKELCKLIAEYNLWPSIRVPGIVPWEELPQYYANCSVYCSPSLWEGYMRCEAFAFEKPMVVFNASANAETVQDGINGFVVKEKTPKALAFALLDLLENKNSAAEMGSKGFRWARENLDLNIITRRLDELLTTIK